MDAFYASIEQRDNPILYGKPVAVGRGEERGVVAAASYEARKFGVKSAMPSLTAKKLCPDLVFIYPRFEHYKRISKEIRTVFYEYTDFVEPLSLDEAYLDVTENKKEIKSAIQVAREIKEKIKERTNLTASAGVSVNKFLAKIASDLDKPDGLYVIKPNDVQRFVNDLDVVKIFGIGKVTAKKMHNMGIYKGKDLKEFELDELINHFGKAGNYFYNLARGIDNREVQPNRESKSVGAERTFEFDLKNMNEITKELDRISKILHERIKKAGKKGKTFTVKIKFSDFKQITRSKTIENYSCDIDIIKQISKELILNENLINKEIRLLGISMSNFEEEDSINQLELDFNV
jgi:DNA polymerase IV